jgi:hypothetical protein
MANYTVGKSHLDQLQRSSISGHGIDRECSDRFSDVICGVRVLHVNRGILVRQTDHVRECWFQHKARYAEQLRMQHPQLADLGGITSSVFASVMVRKAQPYHSNEHDLRRLTMNRVERKNPELISINAVQLEIGEAWAELFADGQQHFLPLLATFAQWQRDCDRVLRKQAQGKRGGKSTT